jgi:hypothetical protein
MSGRVYLGVAGVVFAFAAVAALAAVGSQDNAKSLENDAKTACPQAQQTNTQFVAAGNGLVVATIEGTNLRYAIRADNGLAAGNNVSVAPCPS